MTIYTTSGLGWTPGANESSAMTTFINSTYVSGDTLQFDDVYDLDGNWNLPANLRMEGVSDGDGINMPSTITSNTDLFTGADGVDNVFVKNMTFTADDAPVWNDYRLKSSPTSPTDFQNNNFFSVGDCSGWHFQDCDFQGQVETALKFNDTDAPFIEYCHFYGTSFPISLNGNTRNFRIWNVFIEWCINEGIKTAPSASSSYGPNSDGVIINLKDVTFKRINRSCIDTTGGWKGIRHLRDRAYAANELYDFKINWNSDGDESLNGLLRDVVIDDALWVSNTGRFIVTTQLQKDDPNWLTTTEWSTYGPRDITINNTICEIYVNSGQGSNNSHLLNKAGINMAFDGITRRGFTTLPDNERDYWSEVVGDGTDEAAPTGWTPDTAPSDGGDSGYVTFANVTTAASEEIDPKTEWFWTKKPTATTGQRIKKLGGASGIFLGGSPITL